MEMIRRPLERSEKENREQLAVSERLRESHGDPDGNRHERRLAARRERLEARKERANANG